MFKIGQYLVYKKDVCILKDIKEKEGTTYYQLIPTNDETLKIEIKADTEGLREVISKKDIDNLINSIPSIDVLDCSDRLIELEYRNLISNGDKESLIKVIKTAYLRNKERLDHKKKLCEKDVNYLEKAENLLYNEFSVVLNLTIDEIRKYIMNIVEALA